VPMESEVFCQSDGKAHNYHQNEKVYHYNLLPHSLGTLFI